jgi:prevent-host-death family protein
MPRMTTTEARKDFSDALNRVAYKGERIEIRRRGKTVAAIVPFDDLKLIEELEDKILLADMKKSEKDRGGITLAQLKKKLEM